MKTYLCLCDCGKKHKVTGANLRSGAVKSCGCLAIEARKKNNTIHGHTKEGKITRTYLAWREIKSRCDNKNHISYKRYGAKGIKYCKKWKRFDNFLFDMGECPPHLTLDRINNLKGYYKKNCRWATKKEQAVNRKTTHLITWNGETMCIADWAKAKGIKYPTLRARIIKFNWPIERALLPRSQK